MSAVAELVELLVECFSAPEIRQLAMRHAPGAMASLPGASASALEHAQALVEALRRHGALDREFYDALRERRGDLAPRVEAIERALVRGGVAGPDPKLEAIYDAYHRRHQVDFHRWEMAGLAAVQPGGHGAPVGAELDQMYLDLRLGRNQNPEKTDQGEVIGVDALLRRARPLLIRGQAGSGKTTWMRRTFRALMETLPARRAIPLFVELRRLAAAWPDTARKDRTLEHHLCETLPDVAGLDAAALAALLRAEQGPRPVLLVDGWDELGALGEELRARLLGLLRACPRVLAVVSSRPYGASRPTATDGFEELDIQPLGDAEIELFAGRFYGLVHGQDARDRDRSVADFLAALRASPEARGLAGTMLMLTLMLLISRSQPLPDRRHELYEKAVETLLSARPALREQQGARAGPEQWRPEGKAERWRAVAGLAHGVQSRGYRASGRRTILLPRAAALRLLPERWEPDQREGFLCWLVGSAGLLDERADEQLCFAHLSFQEYLTAWHLERTADGGPARVAVLRDHMRDGGWWETLRLWAARVEDRDPDRLLEALEAVVEDADGYWLAGAVMADGAGLGGMAGWIEALPGHLNFKEHTQARRGAAALRHCRNGVLRTAIARTWPAQCEQTRLMTALAGVTWVRDAGAIADWRPGPRLRALANPVDASSMALGRRLGAWASVWPGAPLFLLRLWPCPRATVSTPTQELVTSGLLDHARMDRWMQVANKEQIHDVTLQYIYSTVQRVDRNYVYGDLGRAIARTQGYFVWDVAPDALLGHARDFVETYTHRVQHYLVRRVDGRKLMNHLQRLAMDLALDMLRGGVKGRKHAQIIATDIAKDLARGSALNLAWHFGASTYPECADRSMMSNWLHSRGFGPIGMFQSSQRRDLIDIIVLELTAYGQSVLRPQLAHAGSLPPDPLFPLFQQACRLSLHPAADPSPFLLALSTLPPDTDPLWPALARHICRRSTPEDRALLIDLAQHPEQREGPLSWGLQVLVRGDVYQPDGTWLTLDELSAQAGLDPLPYLEDMPDELELPDDL